MDNFNLYKDIQARTGGEIYIGVVGPVRTGKSTFIKRFMDLLVIPNIQNVHNKERTIDELPQSAAGRTIMTTEPKFIPKEAAKINISDNTEVSVRLIDCVGYMVNGATGHIENEQERLVKTPWYDYEIPFTKAAEIGTKKVINDHSTIGIVVTTDGSFGDLDRESYLEAEHKTIHELKALKKPFIVLLNSDKPFSEETVILSQEIATKYNTTVLPLNCEQLKQEDIYKIMESVLYEFPVTELDFYIPKWVEMLQNDHWLKREIIMAVKQLINDVEFLKDISKEKFETNCPFIKQIKVDKKDLSNGSIVLFIDVDDSYYYEILSDLTGADISGEYQLIKTIKDLSKLKNEYEKVSEAMQSVKFKGYGVVTPIKEEITLEKPEVIKTGNKYGVKIKAEAPSIHMIRANILTEIAPIVGTEEQAKDLQEFINENSETSEDGIWNTNIFGKTIEQIVEDGIRTKIAKLSDETQNKMQNALQKITNDGNGGVIFIII